MARNSRNEKRYFVPLESGNHIFDKKSMSATSLRPSIHILGAGSIGQLWAISLRSKFPSYPVSLIKRDNGNGNPSPSNQSFLWKYPDWERPRAVTIPVLYNTGAADALGPIETLLVTTKSYQAKDAITTVLQTCCPARVVLLCNGALSVRDELLPLLKENDIPLILATTTHGAYRDTTIATSNNNNSNDDIIQDPCLVHAGIGKTFIQEEASDLSLLWNEAGLHCSTLTESAMDQLLWKKLAANCVINPLTALFRCLNGELWMEPSFFELQQEILHEITQVAQASIKIRGGKASTNSTPATTTSLDEVALRQFVGQVIQDTRENKSSMLQDVLQNRKTEIDHLNNYIVKKGRSLGIDCPVNEDLVARIHGLG